MASERSEEHPSRPGILRILTARAILLFLLFTVVRFRGSFEGSYDSLVGFRAANFSSLIDSSHRARITFRPGGDHLENIYTRFTPESEDSLLSSVTATVYGPGGEELSSATYSGMSLYLGQYQNIPLPASGFEKGKTYTVTFTCDSTDVRSSYRLVLGSGLGNEVEGWRCESGEDETGLVPELHMVYSHHFGVKTFVLYIAIYLLSALAVLMPRTPLWEKVRGPFSLLILIFSAPALIWAVELLSYGSVIYMDLRIILSNILLLLGAGLLIASLTGRAWAGTLFNVLFCTAAGMMNHFTILYRGSSISPVDIFALRSAAAVVSHYTFSLDMPILLSVAVFVAVLVFNFRYADRRNRETGSGLPARLAGILLSAAMLVFTCTPLSRKWNGMYIYLKEYTESARRNGMIYNFVQAVPYLRLSKPEGYSSREAGRIAEKYMTGAEEFGGMKPDVVMVMMETWSDWSDFTDLSYLSSDPMSYLHSVEADSDPNTLTGRCVVPVYGSGTCNTEFEAVTGLSMRNLVSGSFPYLQYVTRGTPSMASYLKGLGYETTALHPGLADTWNRKMVYPWMGFDASEFETDFTYTDEIHRLISDRSCFNETLKCLPEDESRPPAFVFCVTISNHGGYRKHEDFDLIVTSARGTGTFIEMETYSSLLKYTSGDLEYFIGELEKRDRPTLVIFWGDHLPSLDSRYLDYIHFDDIMAADPALKYTTPYMVWANFDIHSEDIPETVSSNYIGLLALKLSGLPLNGWYSLLDGAMAARPVYGIRETVYSGTAEERREVLREYSYLEYAAIKDRKSVPEEFFTAR